LKNKKVSIGSDHAGYHLKEALKRFLVEDGYDVVDEGTFDANFVDYPDYAKKVCKDVQKKVAGFGILICGTGIGMSITANKFKGIRASLCLFPEMARLARAHNNANVLVLPGRFMAPELARLIVHTFSNTEFEGGRHSIRLEKISRIEKREKDGD